MKDSVTCSYRNKHPSRQNVSDTTQNYGKQLRGYDHLSRSKTEWCTVYNMLLLFFNVTCRSPPTCNMCLAAHKGRNPTWLPFLSRFASLVCNVGACVVIAFFFFFGCPYSIGSNSSTKLYTAIA